MGIALVIGDDQLLQYAISKTLHPYFSGVKVVLTGEDAVREISSCHYDVCFFDMNPHENESISLLKNIKKLSPGTKVVLMTDMDMDEGIKKELNGCYFCHLIKPFDISEIKSVAELSKASLQTGEEWFAENRQSSKRQLVDKTADFKLTLIENGLPVVINIQGNILDISESGYGLKTFYPLESGHLITISDNGRDSQGIVKWSKQTDDSYMYRAGVTLMSHYGEL
jgi:DNA-binding NtrC family response regulator